MRISIIGAGGMVGGALMRWLKKNTPHEIIAIDSDPDKGMHDSADGADAYFICIPVHTEPNRKQNYHELQHVVRHIKNPAPIFIKSTVLPGTCDHLNAIRDVGFVYAMPEFLSEKTCDEDFDKHPILVGIPPVDESHILSVVQDIFPGKVIEPVSNREAELAKYAHNAFAAVKVNFFNWVRELSDSMHCSYGNVLDGMMISGFYTRQHTKVPGPDGSRGYGGKCLPKDLKAFIGFARSVTKEEPFSLLMTELENDRFRGKNARDPGVNS